MSRNKDKYESGNRRQQIFMSPEDIAAGKKSNWTGIEITGVLVIFFFFLALYTLASYIVLFLKSCFRLRSEYQPFIVGI